MERWKEEEKTKLHEEMDGLRQLFVTAFKDMARRNRAIEEVSKHPASSSRWARACPSPLLHLVQVASQVRSPKRPHSCASAASRVWKQRLAKVGLPRRKMEPPVGHTVPSFLSLLQKLQELQAADVAESSLGFLQDDDAEEERWQAPNWAELQGEREKTAVQVSRVVPRF